ncbi:mannose-1-phosphate guanylyltransferase/mannose-6-phosphate isomerase [Thalassotalea atypica]|uniref:mannose-1-phosphate guanylyltransferase/mannose-6-phosphate isomerase n=1 Tax=Thalassotalea atypica TaxID=2054316 RepID=UPI00257363F4|nr:mannose-1-phosphate guanylyltransferase/mannose-6-phosphate isomerase [Thalassotalea atypica]
MEKIYPTIMCGGSGTRLWPLSRSMYPKQFLSLTSDFSMLQETVKRLPQGTADAICICNEEHRFLVAEQLRTIDTKANILLEPEGRNTAPAIALAAFKISEQNPEGLMLVLASDHVIKDRQAFHSAIAVATNAAQKDKLVTFGIVPTVAETGYGYIKQGSELQASVHEVAQFVEKPDKQTAEQYLASGNYLWNSGMFMFKASEYLATLQQYRPDIFEACEKAMAGAQPDLDFIRPERKSFLDCASESIDYAVMEKTADAVVVPLNAGWSDVGSYSALWDVSEQDENNNVLRGDVIPFDTNDCYIHSEHKLIATVGVSNLVVVDTPDAVMVANKDDVQQVKHIVEQLKVSERIESSFHRKVYRPWGNYDSIDMGERFQVKRISVKPGAKLSVQMHHHRAEHWIIVSGTAKVTIDDDTILMSENQSAYIPIGAVHALENPGKLPLEMIEVQSGSYLGEDDIVRFEDRYGRAPEQEEC